MRNSEIYRYHLYQFCDTLISKQPNHCHSLNTHVFTMHLKVYDFHIDKRIKLNN